MRLTDEEAEDLKDGKPTRCWRFGELRHADIGKSYVSGGRDHTIIDVRKLSAADVLRTQGKKIYDELGAKRVKEGGEWPVWLVIVVEGDRTDRPRLMQPSGRKSGDYTSVPGMAMPGEPEALTAKDLEPYVREAQQKLEVNRNKASERKRRGKKTFVDGKRR